MQLFSWLLILQHLEKTIAVVVLYTYHARRTVGAATVAAVVVAAHVPLEVSPEGNLWEIPSVVLPL